MQAFDQQAAADLRTAFEAHQAGHLDKAEAGYRRVLSRFPDHPETLNFAGFLAHQRGDPERALALLGRSLELSPDNPQFLCNLAQVQQAVGQLESAAESYRRSLTLNGRDLRAHYNLALVLEALGRPQEAEESYRNTLALKPSDSRALINLGNLLKAQHRLDEAAACFRRALAVDPRDLLAQRNLALTLWQMGRHEEAERGFRQVLAIEPDDAASLRDLGGLAAERGALSDAIAWWRRALAVEPRHADTLHRLGQLLMLSGGAVQAAECFRRTIELHPEKPEPHCYLAHALKEQGKVSEAITECERALELKPDLPLAYSNLALILKDQGRVDEALGHFDRLAELAPQDVLFHSNRLMTMQYSERISVREIFECSKLWGELLEPLNDAQRRPHVNDPQPDRRLRIGYVSPDFRQHSVSYFFAPLLSAHDRQQVEVTCYAEVGNPDHVTERLKKLADHWRDTNCRSQEDVAAQVRADGIDILVDLAGHTALSRLPAFAHRPAPIQVSWCGYPGTTGLEAIDYRLTDDLADPPGDADDISTERHVRLKSGFLCYEPSSDSPEVAPPPSVDRGYPTFGSFNNLAKVTPIVVEIWSELLLSVPGSRLLIKALPLADEATRNHLLSMFASHDIESGRLELLPFIHSTEGHLGAYAGIDVALDPFPYNGTTTTCEALWMGVPVVTLRGDRHAGRVGASLLTRVDLTDLIGETREHYIEIARGLVQDRKSLMDLRQTLRERIAASALCDASGFARAIEQAYREMWHSWCETAKREAVGRL